MRFGSFTPLAIQPPVGRLSAMPPIATIVAAMRRTQQRATRRHRTCSKQHIQKDRQRGGLSEIQSGVLIRLRVQQPSASCASQADPTRQGRWRRCNALMEKVAICSQMPPPIRKCHPTRAKQKIRIDITTIRLANILLSPIYLIGISIPVRACSRTAGFALISIMVFIEDGQLPRCEACKHQ